MSGNGEGAGQRKPPYRGRVYRRIAPRWPVLRLNRLSAVVIHGGASSAGVFTNPPTLQFMQDFIVADSQGLRYKGEIGGAVLIPDFLWA
jgi:hypothetical protein